MKIFFKKLFFDFNIFSKNNKKNIFTFPLKHKTFYDDNLCSLQKNILLKSEFDNKCFNFDYLLKNNYIYSQIRYSDFFKVLYNLILSFFKII